MKYLIVLVNILVVAESKLALFCFGFVSFISQAIYYCAVASSVQFVYSLASKTIL